MIPAQAAFAVLSAMALGGALISVISAGLFRSALGLMLSLVGVAGLFLLQQAEFLAVVQVMVYVGGVSVLIVFAIMLTERGRTALAVSVNPRMAVAGGFVAAILAGTVAIFLWESDLGSSPAASVAARDIGTAIMNEYVVPFEALGVLLLAALIGALFIARERK